MAGGSTGVYARELRIAPVMTGGTSLAVWMGGVTAELYRVLTSRREVRESTRIYRELLELTKTEPRVDVITGTSAGGLNGSLLAAAWYLELPLDRFMSMRSIWLELGNLAALLRSPNESNPPSLLRGDDYFATQLRQVLTEWKATGVPDEQREFRALDLLITVTTVRGDPVYRSDDFGQQIGEVTHRHHLQFKCEGLSPADRNDFGDDEWVARLATASRTSASIPGVFEPSFLIVAGGKGESSPGDRPVYTRDQASFSVSKWAVDGGVTVNLPLGEAIDRIFRQKADRDLRRVVLYVKPTPTLPAEAKAERAGDMPTIAAALQTTSKAPRAEGIASDIDDIREHNLQASRQRVARAARLARLQNSGALKTEAERAWPTFVKLRVLGSVTDMMDAASSRLGPELRARQPEIEEQLRVPRAGAMAARADQFESASGDRPWGWGISSIEHAAGIAMTVLSTTFDLPLPQSDELDDATSARFEELGVQWARLHDVLDRVHAVRRLDDAYWAHQLDALERTPELRAGNDVGALERWADDAYASWPFVRSETGATVEQPDGIKRAKEKLDALAGDAIPHSVIADSMVSALLAYVLRLGRDLAELVRELRTTAYPLALEAVKRVAAQRALTSTEGVSDDELVRQLDVLVDANDVYAADASVGEPILSARDVEILEPALEVLRLLDLLVPPGTAATGDDVLHNLLYLHVNDTVYQGGVSANEQILELLQVSWDAPNELDDRAPASKLAGTEVARLGAFLKRSWRANDWMWGRLDGAQRMVVMLLEPKRLRQLGCTPVQVMEAIDRIMAVSPDDPIPEGVWGAAEQAAAMGELNFLASDTLPTPRSLPRCIAAISFALQARIVQEELPYVYDALEVTERDGGADGESAFRALYKRKVTRATGPGGATDDRIARVDGPELLRTMRIGDERAVDEIGHDLFTRTATSAAAVVVKAATGERAGVPLLTRAARPLRLPTIALYALGRIMTTASRTAVALLAIALAVSGALLGISIVDSSDVSDPVTAVSALVFLIALAIALLRSRLWTAVPALIAGVIVVLAVVGGDIGTLLFDAPGDVPTWKEILFVEPWAIAFILTALAVLAALLRFGAAIVDHWRLHPTGSVTPAQWAAIDRRRYVRLFRRGAALVLLVPVGLLTFQWLMEQLFLTNGDDPVKHWVDDAATWLNEQKLWVVALTVAVLGALIGIGYDRTLSVLVARAWRFIRRPFFSLAQRGALDSAPDAAARQPLPHPFSRMTSAQRWAAFVAAMVLLVAAGVAMTAIDGSMPQWTDDFHVAAESSRVWLLVVDYPFMVGYGLTAALTFGLFASLWSKRAERLGRTVSAAEQGVRLAEEAAVDEATAAAAVAARVTVTNLSSRQQSLVSITMAASIVTWLPFVIVLLDSLENGFLLGYLGGRSSWTACAAEVFSIAKWGAVALTLLVFIVVAVGYLGERLGHRHD